MGLWEDAMASARNTWADFVPVNPIYQQPVNQRTYGPFDAWSLPFQPSRWLQDQMAKDPSIRPMTLTTPPNTAGKALYGSAAENTANPPEVRQKAERLSTEQAAIQAGASYDPGNQVYGGAVAEATRMYNQGQQGALRYVFGGGRGNPSTTDCSDFVARAYAKVGVSLTPQTDAMFKQTSPLYRIVDGISMPDQPRAGDLVFFQFASHSDPSVYPHVGIIKDFIGGRPRIIHASQPHADPRQDIKISYVDDVAAALGARVVYRRVMR